MSGAAFAPEDLELLSRPLLALVTVSPRGDRWPAPRPVWFELSEAGTIGIFSFAGAARLERLRAVPRASVVVVAPVGEPEQWVSVEGSVSLHEDGAHELAARSAERYYGSDDTEHREMVDSWATEDLVRIELHPERIQRYRI